MNAASVLSSPISFVTVSNDGNFEVSSEAIEYLQQIRGPIAVVAIAGLYRTGKSYLLNLLLGRDQKKNRMFDVGATINACTKGIWIWGQPVANQKSHATFPHLGKDTTIVFMDTEGLGSIERSQTQDTQIFALALLLSSLFIYNSRGVIDANAIEDLSLVVNLTKIIQAKAHNDKKATNCNELSRFFPDFLWVVRDFTLELKQDGKKMTSKDYFETALKQQHSFTENVVQKNKSRSLLSTFFPSRDCVTMVRPLHDEKQLRELSKQPYESLRPEFREQMEILKKKLSMSLKPKTMMSNVLNGPMLVSLTKNYVAAFNSGSSPVITSVWDRVIESQCDQALDSAKQVFREKLDAAIAEKTNLVRVNQVMRARPLEDVELVSLYETARKAADRELLREDIVSISSLKDYSLTLSEYSLEILQTKFKDNDAVSTVFNKEILQELWKPCKEPLKDPSLIAEDEAQYLQNQLTASQDFLSSIVTQFNDRAAGSRKHGVLNHFLLENMVEGMFEWSTLVKTFFRSKEAQLAADIASSQHSLRSIESKVRVAQEMLTQQNDSFEKAVQSIAERITSERNTLIDDIQSKQSQIDRTRLQVEQLGTLHQEVLDRLDAQIQEAKDERNQLEAAIHSAEVCQEKERQEAQRQLLQSEAKFHNEEKTLIQGQQQILKKVLELERCLGEQDVNQLAELSRVEKENTEEILRLQLQFQELEEELRESAVQNIQVLEKEQEQERDVLQWNLDEKKKRLVILCKLLDEKEAAKTTPFYSGEECIVQ